MKIMCEVTKCDKSTKFLRFYDMTLEPTLIKRVRVRY